MRKPTQQKGNSECSSSVAVLLSIYRSLVDKLSLLLDPGRPTWTNASLNCKCWKVIAFLPHFHGFSPLLLSWCVTRDPRSAWLHHHKANCLLVVLFLCYFSFIILSFPLNGWTSSLLFPRLEATGKGKSTKQRGLVYIVAVVYTSPGSLESRPTWLRPCDVRASFVAEVYKWNSVVWLDLGFFSSPHFPVFGFLFSLSFLRPPRFLSCHPTRLVSPLLLMAKGRGPWETIARPQQ